MKRKAAKRMRQVSEAEVRQKLGALLEEVASGTEIAIVRAGAEVARLVPPAVPKRLPPLDKFRASIRVKGEPLSQTVIRSRREARY